MTETWKDIIGFEGSYQVSSLGRVRSLDREDGYRGRVAKGRILKYSLAAGGYPRCALSKNNKPNERKVHRLVADAFVSNPDNKECVNHIDGNKQNNAASNLEWVTHSENMEHSFSIGIRVNSTKKKLTDLQVLQIRELKATTKITYKELGEMFNVHPANLSNIVNHKARKVGLLQ